MARFKAILEKIEITEETINFEAETHAQASLYIQGYIKGQINDNVSIRLISPLVLEKENEE